MSVESWIRLAKLESPKKAVTLVDYFGDPDAVFEARAAQLADVDGISIKTAERFLKMGSEPVDEALKALDKTSARVVTYRDGDSPRTSARSTIRRPCSSSEARSGRKTASPWR